MRDVVAVGLNRPGSASAPLVRGIPIDSFLKIDEFLGTDIGGCVEPLGAQRRARLRTARGLAVSRNVGAHKSPAHRGN
jgi:hypothetical protein